MKPETPSAWLQAVDAFSGLGLPELRRLLARCFTQTISRGASVVDAGESANALHVLVSGRLAVQDATGASEMAPGAVVGGAAFFTRGVHERTVLAARDSLVLTLEWDEFTQLADRAPEYWQAVAISLAKRAGAAPIAAAHKFPKPRTLAILGAGAAPLGEDIVKEITVAFDPLADCQVLRSASFGQNLPGGITLDDPEVAHWLREQQQAFDLIIRVADPEVNDWTRNSILEADEILLIAMDAARQKGDTLNAAEALAFELRGAHACRLILVSGSADQNLSSSRWLAPRAVRFHHRVDMAAPGSFERVARFVLGRATGYVACGGAAFAAGHLGLLQALTEFGAPIDCIGGTGTGALAAALYAQNVTIADAQRFFPPPRARADFEQQIRAAFSNLDILNTALPFRALSADLTAGLPVIHSSGSIVNALLANWPPPGLASPFISESGVHLADGGLIDATPAWLLNDIHDGPNILGRIEPPLPLGASAKEAASTREWALRRITGMRSGETLDPFDMANLMLRGISLRGAHAALTNGALTLSPPLRAGEDEQNTACEAAYLWAMKELERMQASGEGALIFNR